MLPLWGGMILLVVAVSSPVAVVGFDPGVGGGSLVKTSGLWRASWTLPDRGITVWLPPGYDDPANALRRYPALYVHDGQNAMVDTESWTGYSWRLGETISKLAENGEIAVEPIVVMIDNAAGEFLLPVIRRRHLEYGDGPFSGDYRDMVSDVVRPAVDRLFRTRTGPQHTSQLGTSLGGSAAFLACFERPDAFGAAACLSPAFSAATLGSVVSGGGRLRDAGQRIYLDNGGDADGKAVPIFEQEDVAAAVGAAAAAAASLASGSKNRAEDDGRILNPARLNPGYFWLDTYLQPSVDVAVAALKFHGVEHEFRQIPGGRHNERAWGKRMEQPLKFLYGPQWVSRLYK